MICNNELKCSYRQRVFTDRSNDLTLGRKKIYFFPAHFHSKNNLPFPWWDYFDWSSSSFSASTFFCFFCFSFSLFLSYCFIKSTIHLHSIRISSLSFSLSLVSPLGTNKSSSPSKEKRTNFSIIIIFSIVIIRSMQFYLSSVLFSLVFLIKTGRFFPHLPWVSFYCSHLFSSHTCILLWRTIVQRIISKLQSTHSTCTKTRWNHHCFV